MQPNIQRQLGKHILKASSDILWQCCELRVTTQPLCCFFPYLYPCKIHGHGAGKSCWDSNRESAAVREHRAGKLE